MNVLHKNTPLQLEESVVVFTFRKNEHTASTLLSNFMGLGIPFYTKQYRWVW
jgi:hypothetical protein